VRAAARRADVLEARGWEGVDCVSADAFEPATLDAALSGIDVAYYLVHSMGGGGGFAERDKRAAENFRDAAARAGVQRIVYLGGIRPSGEASVHLASRLETGDVLRAGPVPVTELRAGLIVGAGSVGFEVIRDLVNHLPVMITPRWVQSRQAIALDDLLAYLQGVLEHWGRPAAPTMFAGRTWSTATSPATYAKFGRPFRRQGPFLTPRLSSLWKASSGVPIQPRPLVEGSRRTSLGTTRDRQFLPIPFTATRNPSAALAAKAGGAIRRAGQGRSRSAATTRMSVLFEGRRAEFDTAAPAEATWDVVRSIGGKNGYYYANTLWWLRGAFDRLIGGVGLRRGRRHPTDLRIGDALDFWRVVALEPGERLTLLAEMKVPAPSGVHGCRWTRRIRLRMEAQFHRRASGDCSTGTRWGRRNFIFRRMPRNMAKAGLTSTARIGRGRRVNLGPRPSPGEAAIGETLPQGARSDEDPRRAEVQPDGAMRTIDPRKAARPAFDGRWGARCRALQAAANRPRPG
jgi:uncharacterized protein YbjT (DUF2867 family)